MFKMSSMQIDGISGKNVQMLVGDEDDGNRAGVLSDVEVTSV